MDELSKLDIERNLVEDALNDLRKRLAAGAFEHGPLTFPNVDTYKEAKEELLDSIIYLLFTYIRLTKSSLLQEVATKEVER